MSIRDLLYKCTRMNVRKPCKEGKVSDPSKRWVDVGAKFRELPNIIQLIWSMVPSEFLFKSGLFPLWKIILCRVRLVAFKINSFPTVYLKLI